MVRSVLGLTIWLPDRLTHYIIRQRVEDRDGKVVLRVYLGCGRRKTFTKDPAVNRNVITCLPCLVAWLHDAGYSVMRFNYEVEYNDVIDGP